MPEPAVLNVESSVELPPIEASPSVEIAPVEAAPVGEAAPSSRSSSKSRRRNRRAAEGTDAPANEPSKSRRRRNRRGKQADAQSVAPAQVDASVAAPAIEASPVADELEVDIEIIAPPAPVAAPIHVSPARAVTHAPHRARPARRPAAPTMVLTIDDADPDSAERTREARDAREDKEPSRRSFLPPVLLDEERSGRQGGLTLAVIILLIVATLTLSYLMRRPSSSGEGITQRETATHRVA
jgi:hypothetical protein